MSLVWSSNNSYNIYAKSDTALQRILRHERYGEYCARERIWFLWTQTDANHLSRLERKHCPSLLQSRVNSNNSRKFTNRHDICQEVQTWRNWSCKKFCVYHWHLSNAGCNNECFFPGCSDAHRQLVTVVLPDCTHEHTNLYHHDSGWPLLGCFDHPSCQPWSGICAELGPLHDQVHLLAIPVWISLRLHNI